MRMSNFFSTVNYFAFTFFIITQMRVYYVPLFREWKWGLCEINRTSKVVTGKRDRSPHLHKNAHSMGAALCLKCPDHKVLNYMLFGHPIIHPLCLL